LQCASLAFPTRPSSDLVLYRLLSALVTLAVHTLFRTPGSPEMRHSCLFAAVSLTLLILSGCRIESGGDSSSTLNPASNVDLTFRSEEHTSELQSREHLV